ncbi:MAG: TatD family hydrolase [Acidobacteria bacterium]|nr:TatD family hydrolase [Acidobacteriota bacterium]
MTVGDAHCHLADLPEPDEAVAEARAAGVSVLLAVSMTPDDALLTLDLKRRHPGVVLAGVGLHPSRVPGLTDEQAAAELGLVAERVKAADFVGEIGLDYRDAPDSVDQRRQREILDRLLDVAERARLPVNMHSRRADGEIVDIAAAFTGRTGLPALLHWFTHSRRLARRCADAGVYISAGPSIQIDPTQARVARAIDPDLVLVETDSPVEYAGVRASPAWAQRVAQALAAARGESPDRLRERLSANLGRYLGREISPVPPAPTPDPSGRGRPRT